MKVHGQCHCGRVRFTAEVDPAETRICHCTDCQSSSGSAYRVNVRALEKDFVMLGEAPAVYIKTADSGSQRAQAFCGNCGSGLYSAAPKDSPAYMLRVGILAERDQLAPRRQIWRRSAMPWSADIGHLEGPQDQGG